jgi:hypothetical protein
MPNADNLDTTHNVMCYKNCCTVEKREVRANTMTQMTTPENSSSYSPTTLDSSSRAKQSAIMRFNDKIANVSSVVLSSMWLFWILLIILAVAFFLQPPKGAYEMVIFFVGATFQAIALPVLAFVSNIQGDRQEKIMNEMHAEILEELNILKEQVRAIDTQPDQ